MTPSLTAARNATANSVRVAHLDQREIASLQSQLEQAGGNGVDLPLQRFVSDRRHRRR